MLHVILKYPEVAKNLDFIKVSTIPLDLHLANIVNSDTDTEYVTYVVNAIASFHRPINLDDLILHTENQLLILDDMKPYKISVDKVTQFGLRPSELREFSGNLEIIIIDL